MSEMIKCTKENKNKSHVVPNMDANKYKVIDAIEYKW